MTNQEVMNEDIAFYQDMNEFLTFMGSYPAAVKFIKEIVVKKQPVQGRYTKKEIEDMLEELEYF